MSDLLRGLCQEYELERLYPFLADAALPAVLIEPDTVAEDQAPATASHVGGRPDLPTGFEWPMNNGRPLDFLMQIDLAAASPHDRAGLLPNSGRLAILYDMMEQPWGYDPDQQDGFAAIYFGPDVALTPTEVPDGQHQPDPAELQFRPTLTLPSFGSRAYDRLAASSGQSDEEADHYFLMIERFHTERCGSLPARQHRLLGHSSNIQGDMQLEAQLVTSGLYCGDPSAYDDPRTKDLGPGADDWLLLLQIDTDYDVDMTWGDEGMLYFWIRGDDLRRRRFDNVWMSCQCH